MQKRKIPKSKAKYYENQDRTESGQFAIPSKADNLNCKKCRNDGRLSNVCICKSLNNDKLNWKRSKI